MMIGASQNFLRVGAEPGRRRETAISSRDRLEPSRRCRCSATRVSPGATPVYGMDPRGGRPPSYYRTISKSSRFNAGFQVPVHGIDFVPEIWIIERMAGF